MWVDKNVPNSTCGLSARSTPWSSTINPNAIVSGIGAWLMGLWFITRSWQLHGQPLQTHRESLCMLAVGISSILLRCLYSWKFSAFLSSHIYGIRSKSNPWSLAKPTVWLIIPGLYWRVSSSLFSQRPPKHPIRSLIPASAKPFWEQLGRLPNPPQQLPIPREEYLARKMIVRSVMILCIMLRKQLLLSVKNVVMRCIRNVSSSVCCYWFSDVAILIMWEDEKSALQTSKTLTCVWCRSEHGIKGSAKPATLKMQRGPFINLASTIPSIAGLRRTCMSNSSFRRGLRCIEVQEFVIDPSKEKVLAFLHL